ncbi:MAG: SDR family NAD(P)-dependent oxidoreductase [Alphaproteobacteria bacterium]
MHRPLSVPDLAGKAALVTGSSTGIGAGVARLFGAQGMAVAVHCNNHRDEADAVAADVERAGGRAVVLQGDVRDAATCARLVGDAHRAFGRLDVLVNNAGGVVRRTPVRDSDDDLYDLTMDLNARPVFACSRAAIPLIEQAGGGSIISTTSIAARSGGGGNSVLYAGAKGFVSSFTRSLAKEVARHGIRVNAVSPGVVTTERATRTLGDKRLEATIRITPMRRTGTVEECAATFLYLASPSLSGFVTGQVVEVNGGMLFG